MILTARITVLRHDDKISESRISLRKAMANLPLFGGKGFQKNGCKPTVNQCHNNRSVRFKNKFLYGSKCHGS